MTMMGRMRRERERMVRQMERRKMEVTRMKWRVTRNERCVYIDMGTGVLGMTMKVDYMHVMNLYNTALSIQVLFFILYSLYFVVLDYYLPLYNSI